MNKVLRAAVRAMSKHQGDLTENYEETRKKEKIYPYYKGRSCNTMDRILHLKGRDLLLRTFSYDGKVAPLILFFHGGGFVTGDFESYGNVCANLSEKTGYKVVSVNYRLAPEYKFPKGLNDCYEAMQEVLAHCEDWYQVKPEDVVIMGDSAGGTICSVISMMARDREARMPRRQVLIYPAAYGSYEEDNPYPSLRENGTDYILTRELMCQYMELYRSSKEDENNPYFAPLRHTDFTNLPDTLIITMEYDPLRDEGEALGEKIREAGGNAEIRRISDGIHGMVLLPPVIRGSKEIYQYIGEYLNGRAGEEKEEKERESEKKKRAAKKEGHESEKEGNGA